MCAQGITTVNNGAHQRVPEGCIRVLFIFRNHLGDHVETA